MMNQLLSAFLLFKAVAGNASNAAGFDSSSSSSSSSSSIAFRVGISLEKESREDSSSSSSSFQQDRNQHLRELSDGSQQRQNILKKPAPWEDLFVDGTETYYDENAQAWRLLGFYQDCDTKNSNQEDNAQECQRYLLWAAYIDQGYDANTEYMHYDRHSSSWNKDACNSHQGRRRCVKMDCHESTTNWKLLGIFKERQYDAFLESVLQFQGDCVWNDNEYKFMQAMATDGMPWPVECTAVQDTDLYYHVQPSAGGFMNVALYEDEKCSKLYTGDGMSIESVLAPTVSSTLRQEIDTWNDALQAFTYCQPCNAIDLVSTLNRNTQANAEGDRYGQANDQNNNNNNGAFVCQDATAESGNQVNQCKIFRQQTNMQTASFRDIQLAESQGTVKGIHIANHMLGEPYKKKHTWLSVVLFLLSLLLLGYAFYRLYHEDRINSELKEPLVEHKSNHTSSDSNKSSDDNAQTSDDTQKRNRKSSSNNSSSSSRKSIKRGFWGRKVVGVTTSTTAILATAVLSLILSHPAMASDDVVVGRLGTTLASGSDTGCTMLQNRATATFELDAIDLESNCYLVPGNAADIYHLVITGSVPSDYQFDLVEIEQKGYRTTPTRWGESSQGMEYCAPGGSMLYFHNANSTMEKEITISSNWLAVNNGESCCIDQPIAWSWGVSRCPSVIEANDEEVCWSSPNYFLKASSFEYRVARPSPLNDTVVTWASRNVDDNCASIQLSEGAPQSEGPDVPVKQTIATTFGSTVSTDDRCLFLEVSKYLDKPDYWYISGAGVCNGRGGYEFFTAAQIGVGDVFIESCFEMEKLRMVNIKGSSLTLSNLQMEVFLPWEDDEIGCDKTRFPSATPSQFPSSVPSFVPSTEPSPFPSVVPSDVPSLYPSTVPSTVPSYTPTAGPTTEPSIQPSDLPTPYPSSIPSDGPSETPTGAPVETITDSPTDFPTEIPTEFPTETPTDFPSDTISTFPDGSIASSGGGGTTPVEEDEELQTGKKSDNDDDEDDEDTGGSILEVDDEEREDMDGTVPEVDDEDEEVLTGKKTEKDDQEEVEEEEEEAESSTGGKKGGGEDETTEEEPSTGGKKGGEEDETTEEEPSTGKKGFESTAEEDEMEEEEEDDNGTGIESFVREAQQSSGLTTEQLIGTLCGVLLFLLLIVNCLFLRFFLRKRRDGRVGRQPGSNVPTEDPEGTIVTMEELSGGKVMIKKVIPTFGYGQVVQKTVYPNKASVNLEGYELP
ncbi:polymorphic outer membrane domain containing protein [Nitzschia inconspicua]|uniref:Polymorphic outer membrane domain containing protein n=1 Tax=Nitzschia inconspicua TaxID=303405 RepID=A0A9K3KCX0_9STRA|nr:polymorphic outer membrane domain containing protein [Nitzschia inconspicua]